MVSDGCSSVPNNDTDISCFPAANTVTQPPVEEVQNGTGNDFQDCTQFPALFQGQVFAIVNACSDAAQVEPSPSIPEVPIAALLPVAAIGVVGAAALRRSRRARGTAKSG